MGMSKHDQLLTLYSQILSAVDFTVDEDGKISYAPPGAVDVDGKSMVRGVVVEGKRWVLPTKEILDAADWDHQMAFHPLSENFLHGESVVIAKLKAAMNIRAGYVIGELMHRLTEFAADPQRHGSVSAKASKFLKLVPGIKSISADRMASIVEKSDVMGNRRFVNIFLRRGHQILDTKYQRAAIVTFPFREELKGEEPKAFGVPMSKKDQASFQALFDYILPDNDDIQTYSCGSSSFVVPNFEALLLAYAKLAMQLNEIVHTHRKILPTYQDLTINLDWMEGVSGKQLEKLVDVVPALPGNEGEPIRKARTDGAAKGVSNRMETIAKRVFETPAPVKPADEPHGRSEATHDLANETFSQRIERQQRQARQPVAAPATDYGVRVGGYGSRNYTNTLNERVPPWMDDTSTSRVVGGVDPKAVREEESRFGQRAGNYGSGGVAPFSERVRMMTSGRGSAHMPRRGGFQI